MIRCGEAHRSWDDRVVIAFISLCHTYDIKMMTTIKGGALKLHWSNPRGFEPHSQQLFQSFLITSEEDTHPAAFRAATGWVFLFAPFSKEPSATLGAISAESTQ
jgi:hypothetical protein